MKQKTNKALAYLLAVLLILGTIILFVFNVLNDVATGISLNIILFTILFKFGQWVGKNQK